MLVYFLCEEKQCTTQFLDVLVKFFSFHFFFVFYTNYCDKLQERKKLLILTEVSTKRDIQIFFCTFFLNVRF